MVIWIKVFWEREREIKLFFTNFLNLGIKFFKRKYLIAMLNMKKCFQGRLMQIIFRVTSLGLWIYIVFILYDVNSVVSVEI